MAQDELFRGKRDLIHDFDFGEKTAGVFDASLIQTGFFAHVRNPMYVGNFLTMIGFVLLYGSRWGYLIVLPLFTLIYFTIIKNEELYLSANFGKEYEDYTATARVPRKTSEA